MEETPNPTEVPRASIVYLTNSLGKILAVSRKNNPNDFGLPGGKVDPGETDEEAAIREVREETGLKIFNLFKIFEEIDDFGYLTICFTADYTGDISTDEVGKVRWVTRAKLLSGCFGGYYPRLFEMIDKD